jgi:hypothetical protein
MRNSFVGNVMRAIVGVVALVFVVAMSACGSDLCTRAKDNCMKCVGDGQLCGLAHDGCTTGISACAESDKTTMTAFFDCIDTLSCTDTNGLTICENDHLTGQVSSNCASTFGY